MPAFNYVAKARRMQWQHCVIWTPACILVTIAKIKNKQFRGCPELLWWLGLLVFFYSIFYVRGTQDFFIFWRENLRCSPYLRHDASANCCACSLPVVMVVPLMQSIGGNKDGTYTSYMSPLMPHALGLVCKPCSGPLQLKFDD
jgi:hypothetical protein